MSHSWNPKTYRKFEKERSEPFYDLLSLIQPKKEMNIVDLGSGTGDLTLNLYHTLKPNFLFGIDSSLEMLEESKKLENSNLKFNLGSIESFNPTEKYDLIFSNAALQWVDNHGKLFPRLIQYLNEEGQLAIQLPANDDYPTHALARELAQELPYAEFLNTGRKSNVLNIEEYSNMLYTLGFQRQVVRLQVYAHLLDSTENVIDWVKGTLLNYYKSRLSNEMYNQFLKIYRKRLLDKIGWSSPFFFPMKRILIWAQK